MPVCTVFLQYWQKIYFRQRKKQKLSQIYCWPFVTACAYGSAAILFLQLKAAALFL